MGKTTYPKWFEDNLESLRAEYLAFLRVGESSVLSDEQRFKLWVLEKLVALYEQPEEKERPREKPVEREPVREVVREPAREVVREVESAREPEPVREGFSERVGSREEFERRVKQGF